MKKLVYYLIFLLALVMMLLATSACRSHRQLEASSDADSLSLHSLWNMDSLHMDLEFAFDSLSYAVYNDSCSGKCHVVRIAGGRMMLATTCESGSNVLDSAHISRNTSSSVCSAPSGIDGQFHWSIIICILIASFVLLIICRIRK